MRAPAWVVEVLLASGGVDPRRLEMAERVHADPHLAPRRRDRELGDSLERLGIVDAIAGGISVFKAATATAARDPGGRAVGSSQPRHRSIHSSAPVAGRFDGDEAGYTRDGELISRA